MDFERFDTLVVPFPLTDRRATKRRPVPLLTDAAFAEATGDVVHAIITSARQSDWPGDTNSANVMRPDCRRRAKCA